MLYKQAALFVREVGPGQIIEYETSVSCSSLDFRENCGAYTIQRNLEKAILVLQ